MITMENTAKSGHWARGGVPIDAIAADDVYVTSTYSEVLRLKEFIGKSGLSIHLLIIVSDPHHM